MALAMESARTGLAIGGRVAPGWTGRRVLEAFVRPRHHRRPEWEAAIWSQGRPLRAAGLEARAFGPQAPAVLLVHGWEGRGSQLGHLVTPLVAADHGVVVLDGPAHGDSPGERTDPLHYARALVAVGEDLGPLAGVVAHSVGAAATALALARGLRADRAVLLAPPASYVEQMVAFAAFLGVPPRASERFRALAGARLGLDPRELDVDRVAPQLHVPALIVHDREDAEIPFSAAERIAAAWGEARLHAVTGLGHRRLLRDPDTIRVVVDFLTSAVA